MSPVRPIPEGWNTLTPHVICVGALHAIGFDARAFGAIESNRVDGLDGEFMNAALRIGDSVVMLIDEVPEWKGFGPKTLKGSPVTLHLYVPDVDASFAQAATAGATVPMPITDMFWGDRYGQVQDFFGHNGSIATHTRDLTDAQIAEEMMKTAPGRGCA